VVPGTTPMGGLIATSRSPDPAPGVPMFGKLPVSMVKTTDDPTRTTAFPAASPDMNRVHITRHAPVATWRLGVDALTVPNRVGLRLPELQLTDDGGGGGGTGEGVGAADAADAADADAWAEPLADGSTLASADAEESAEAELEADGEADAEGWQAASASSSAIRQDQDLTAQR